MFHTLGASALAPPPRPWASTFFLVPHTKGRNPPLAIDSLPLRGADPGSPLTPRSGASDNSQGAPAPGIGFATPTRSTSSSRRVRVRLENRLIHPGFFFDSRHRGASASVKTSTSSPVTVLISWCRLIALTPVASSTIPSKSGLAVSIR